jgi:uncharacterized protein YndB with AHSA1/START domain
MAVNETYVGAPPEAVFDVLADPESYAHWVVGSSRIRSADANWPAPGARFHHVQGAFGVGLPDNTEVVTAERPRLLVLEARFRPFAVNQVELRIEPSNGGTRVELEEYVTGGLAGILPQFLFEPAFKLRNAESLRRLRKLAEGG